MKWQLYSVSSHIGITHATFSLTKTCTAIVLAIGLSSCAQFDKFAATSHLKPIAHAPYTGILKDIAHQGYRLDNGLTVFLIPDDSVELAKHVSANYNVGSNVERQANMAWRTFRAWCSKAHNMFAPDNTHKWCKTQVAWWTAPQPKTEPITLKRCQPATETNALARSRSYGFLLPALDQERQPNRSGSMKNCNAMASLMRKLSNAVSSTIPKATYHHPVIDLPSNLKWRISMKCTLFNQWYGLKMRPNYFWQVWPQQTRTWVQVLRFDCTQTNPERSQALPVTLLEDKYVTLEIFMSLRQS